MKARTAHLPPQSDGADREGLRGLPAISAEPFERKNASGPPIVHHRRLASAETDRTSFFIRDAARVMKLCVNAPHVTEELRFEQGFGQGSARGVTPDALAQEVELVADDVVMSCGA